MFSRSNCLLCFSTLTHFITRGNLNKFDGREFRMKFVDKLASNVMPICHTRYTHYFFQLENEGRRNLCRAAREYANIDGIDGDDADIPVSFDLIALSFFVDCTTVPISHLKLSRNEIIVHVEKNIFFELYTFALNVIESNWKSCSEVVRNDEGVDSAMDKNELESLIRSTCFENQTVKMNRLSRISKNDRLHLCYAAKTYIEEFSPYSPLPVWRDNRVEGPQEFDADDYRKPVALRCPTVPSLYVYLSDSRNNVQVFLVENKSLPS